MMGKQQTAVEWFEGELAKVIPQFKKAWSEELLKAKQMEREQIINAHCDGQSITDTAGVTDAVEYYTQTYGE